MSKLTFYAGLVEATINSVMCPRILLKSLQEHALCGALRGERDSLPAKALTKLKIKAHRLSRRLASAGIIPDLKAPLSSEQFRSSSFTLYTPARERERQGERQREREKEAERERGGVKSGSVKNQRFIRMHW